MVEDTVAETHYSRVSDDRIAISIKRHNSSGKINHSPVMWQRAEHLDFHVTAKGLSAHLVAPGLQPMTRLWSHLPSQSAPV